jgi:hypothetical protein
VALVAEKARETCLRVEAWEAEPVDRTVQADERGRVGIAD